MIVIAASVQVGEHKYAMQIQRELEAIAEEIAKAASYIQVCFDSDFVNVDSSRVKVSQDLLFNIRSSWAHIKPIINQMTALRKGVQILMRM